MSDARMEAGHTQDEPRASFLKKKKKSQRDVEPTERAGVTKAGTI